MGLVAYPLSAALLALTGNPNLFPTVMMVWISWFRLRLFPSSTRGVT